MRFSIPRLLASLVVAFVALTIGTPSPAFAQKPKPGGGTTTAAYTIVDLRSPYHAADGNWSQTYADKISSRDPVTGLAFVTGEYVRAGQTKPCLWSVSANQSVVATNLAGLIEPRDVNAAGIVAGIVNDRPAILLPNVGVIPLPTTNNGLGQVVALNDPDADGVFEVLGSQQTTPSGNVETLWTVASDGTVLSTRLLVNEQTPNLNLMDVNNSGVMAGVSYRDGVDEPLLAWLDSQNSLRIQFLPNPAPTTIRYFRKMQLDDAGNVVGYGAEPAPDIGEYPRAVVWPVDKPVVSLSSLIGGASTSGTGVATVNGTMQVVGNGFSNATGRYAMLYTNGKITDLNRVSKGSLSWTMGMADGVNSSGWICGSGRVKVGKSNEDHGFVLLPNSP